MIINNEAPIDKDYALRNFPQIDIEGFEVTSELDPFYNCFAWAGGENTIHWEPSTNISKFVFWHTGSNSWSLENFLEHYAHIGFTEVAESAELEQGYDKIAIYVNADNEPCHAARQVESGKWTSKLGIREDIEHSTPECIENDVYGKVRIILKRPKEGKVEMDSPKSKTSEEFETFKTFAKKLVKVPKQEIDEQLKLEREEKKKKKK